MVSLANNTRSGGFFGFSDERPILQSSTSDDELIADHIQLVSSPEVSHQPIRATWAIILAKLLYIALCASAFVVPFFCKDHKCGEDSISLTLYIHGGMWFVLLLLDRYLQLKHDESRLLGYLDFYRRTKNVRRLPFLINSGANAILMVVIKVLDSHCSKSGHCKYLTKTEYIQLLVSLECIAALLGLAVYFARVALFNMKKPLPDVTQEELMTSFVNSHSSADVGFRDENYIDQVMEKQADLIRYLRQHTESLARRNLTLSEEIGRLKAVSHITTSINGHL